MKDPKFSCTYTQSQELLCAYYYKVKKRGVRKWLWLGLAMIVGSVAIYISTRELIDLLFLVLGVGFGVKELIAPYQGAKKEYESLLGKYGLDLPEIAVTLDEKEAVFTCDGKEVILPLEDVLGLHFCKEMIVLKGYETDIILTNVAETEACKKFLKAHCKNAPVYKR